MKLQPDQIRRAAQAVDHVKSIDNDIERLGSNAPDRLPEYGDKIRHLVGRNIMGHFTDSELGEVVFCAIVNQLLDKRSQAVAENSDLIDFPEPPCPKQVVQSAS